MESQAWANHECIQFRMFVNIDERVWQEKKTICDMHGRIIDEYWKSIFPLSKIHLEFHEFTAKRTTQKKTYIEMLVSHMRKDDNTPYGYWLWLIITIFFVKPLRSIQNGIVLVIVYPTAEVLFGSFVNIDTEFRV